MSKKINVSVPANTTTDDAFLFQSHSYEAPRLKIKKFFGPFVTNTGIVSNAKGIVHECYHNAIQGQFADRLNEVSKYYHHAKEDPDKLIILDNDETYLLIHHTWHNNYYHWLCETLLRLWMVRNKCHSMVLLLPSEAELSRFVKETLEPFKFKAIFHIPASKGVLVRKLCMPQLKPVMASYNKKALLGLSKLYIDHSRATKNLPINLGERIYLSRSKSSRRKIVNENEVTDILKAYSFNIIHNEDYSFYEQVELYSYAKFLISVHGAGLTNMLFMPAGAKVFELHKRQTNSKDHHSLVFWYLADALAHEYYHQICDPTDKDADFFEADFIVDVKLLKTNLALMLNA